MTTVIPAVDTERKIEHGVLIDLSLIVVPRTSSVSANGTTATLNFPAQSAAPFAIGQTIVVSGIIPTVYNGTFVVTACTTSSVSYALAFTGSGMNQAGVIATTFYISNCYKEVIYNSNTYRALAGFLTISDIQSNISNANDEIQVNLSAIPSSYIAAVVGSQIKGGEINIYRAFFDYTTQEVIIGEIYRRFTGIINNYAVQEDITTLALTPEVSHTITIIASSIMGVLENKVTGRRTNKQDYQIVYAEIGNLSTDPSMDRVDTLFNQSFDFGKPYTGKAASNVDGGNGSGGNGGYYGDPDTSMYGAP